MAIKRFFILIPIALKIDIKIVLLPSFSVPREEWKIRTVLSYKDRGAYVLCLGCASTATSPQQHTSRRRAQELVEGIKRRKKNTGQGQDSKSAVHCNFS